jgi:cation transport ATPase
MNNDLQRLPFLIRLSRRTTGVIHQNLLFGVVFIVGFEILAGMGWIQPVVGALLHMVAATFVIFNSARIVRFGEEMGRLQAPAPPAPAPRLEAVPTA